MQGRLSGGAPLSLRSYPMAAILAELFGDNPGVPIVVALSGITRQRDTFGEGVEKVIDARVYSGLHFRTADEVGARMGPAGRTLRLKALAASLPEG